MHEVEPSETGVFLVTSTVSGRVYTVTPIGGDFAECSCEFGQRARFAGREPNGPVKVCSHVEAVRIWAKRILALPGPKWT